MWRWLRDRRFCSYKFRRQHPIGNYCLDFFCEEARLSIELDGFQHGYPTRRACDLERARLLQSLGILELRFWNWRLKRERQEVRDAIFNALQKRAPHPLPDYTRPGVLGGDRICPKSKAGSPSPQPSPPRERVSCRTPLEWGHRTVNAAAAAEQLIRTMAVPKQGRLPG